MKKYLLKLADDSLFMGHRLSEWCGKGPYLEEDIALTNIALDQIGQANYFFEYASKLDEQNKSADQLAYLRYEPEYLNAHWVELPNGDYSQTILKVYVFSVYQKLLYQALTQCLDEELSAIAQKSLKEVKYHYTHSVSWMKIFAQGTAESRRRLEDSIAHIWEFSQGLFAKVEEEPLLVERYAIPDTEDLYLDFLKKIEQDFEDFKLTFPGREAFMQKGSRTGNHTEYFGYILCELQYLQRAYPGCEW
ncbi:1,2-phenylacetyl-CoA epoxidase subunit PaaC [Elizabethkingia sp. JS20170427COW]|uniref:1,2-phenylacetyl-CoA epoxidase subunit PaaC n=1 Tax=Elizabethkingia sp. JS20170427COW TaxID=2583851 RepID=UPI00111047D4|nr:1,2-phenylacetyl-CoA epoxidase subunit PaaC [Elizabethkingia sp. JS20170427COW]QCX52525.1 phenylacetate-CoA oxygenase subunit PaaC [Elizabethkingia sp. JS20170427COW]